MEQPGWVQDPSFYYFSGFKNMPGAILVLDGQLREARLFVPPAPLSFGLPVKGLIPARGEASARGHLLTSIEPWENFLPYLKNRVASGISRFYVDGSRRPQATGVPEPMWPVAGEKNLWRRSLAKEFPHVEIVSAFEAISELRWLKSAAEIAILRKNARATAAALLAGIQQIRPGVMQREVEAVVVASCFEVLAFEPMFSFGPDAFYLEDMIVVTAGGHEVLGAGLPYTAKEITGAMARRAQ